MIVPDQAVPDQVADNARVLFGDALHNFWSRRYPQAIVRFERGHELDGANSAPLYFCALVHYQTGQMDLAESTLNGAIQLEKASSVSDWGQLMVRLQGPQRIWLEDARMTAGLR